MNTARLAAAGLFLIVAGFLLVALGASTEPGTSSSAGGFILIGPIPIIFGSGPNSGILVAVAVAITLVMVVVYLVSFLAWSRRARDNRDNPNSLNMTVGRADATCRK